MIRQSQQMRQDDRFMKKAGHRVWSAGVPARMCSGASAMRGKKYHSFHG
jgi:hypothetical protein